MAEPTVTLKRPDIDIQNDIVSIIVQYPPTAADRHHIDVKVADGVVTLTGHVLTPINRRFLLNRIPRVHGVRALDSTLLHDDETIRLDIGQQIGADMFANVRYGTVALSGKVPEGDDLDALAGLIASVPGVVRVVANV